MHERHGFLTAPTVMKYRGSIIRGAFPLLPCHYGALDSFLFKTLCSREYSSSLSHSAPGSCISALNNDGKLHHRGLALVPEAKLRSSNITRALRQFPIQYLLGNSRVIHACNVSKPSKSPRPSDWL